MMGVIFDLDPILINSSITELERKRRNLNKVYLLIHQFEAFYGIDSLIKLLKKNNIPICVVTSSPRSYCERVLRYFGWNEISVLS